MLYNIHFFPSLNLGKMQKYFQPQDLLLPLKVYQQVSILIACFSLLLLLSTRLFNRRHNSKLIFCLYLLAAGAILLTMLGVMGLGVGTSACTVLASYPRKADLLSTCLLI
jgi:hypothetical protein